MIVRCAACCLAIEGKQSLRRGRWRGTVDYSYNAKKGGAPAGTYWRSNRRISMPQTQAYAPALGHAARLRQSARSLLVRAPCEWRLMCC